MCKTFFSLSILLTFCSTVFSQPATDIFIADLRIQSSGMEVGSLTNITDRDGYDSQSMFFTDGDLFYTSIRDGQADIYRYDLANKSISRITHSQEAEYSPTLMPDGNNFSTVRVEADSSQRLWKFSLHGEDASLLLAKIKPVGYHAWASQHLVALFVLGNPNSLYLADIRNGMHEKITGNVGRSLHKIPGMNEISFVHKVSDKDWWIKRLELDGKKITRMIQTPEGSEDYAWTPNGSIFIAQNTKLFKLQPDVDQKWVEVADFNEAGLTGITRIAVSPAGDKLALVANRIAND